MSSEMNPTKNIANVKLAWLRPLLLIALLVGASATRAQSPPDLVNYQGTLLRPDGSPEIGPKTLEFRILDEASSTVWGPQTFPDLALQQGKFNVLLGAVDDDGTSLTLAFQGPGDAARYLSVREAGDTSDRLPLQRIASVPYAMMSASVADGSITKEKLADGAVTAPKLAPRAVESSRIITGGGPYWSVPLGDSYTAIPGLSLSLPDLDGVNHLVVGLRPAMNVEVPVDGDITVSYSYNNTGRFRLEMTRGSQTSHYYSGVGFTANQYGRSSVPFGSIQYVVPLPPGSGPVSLILAVNWTGSGSYSPQIAHHGEIYAYGL